MDVDGNYNVTVLEKALLTINLLLLNLNNVKVRSQTVKSDQIKGEGFIIHSNNHWYALRKIGLTWWDLNSLLNPKQITEENGRHFGAKNGLLSFFLLDS